MNAQERNKLKASNPYVLIKNNQVGTDTFGWYWKDRFQGYTLNKEEAHRYSRKEAKSICGTFSNNLIVEIDE